MLNNNSQKGFVLPPVLIIIALLAIGGGVWVYKNKITNGPIQTVVPLINVPIRVATTTDEMANWKTYRNNEYGYKISLPSDWRVDSTSLSSLYLISPKTDKMLKDYPNQPATQRTDLSIIVEPNLYRLSGKREPIIFNGINAEQVTEESEEGNFKVIYFDNNDLTYQITAANTEIEKKILSSFRFINTTTSTTSTTTVIKKDTSTTTVILNPECTTSEECMEVSCPGTGGFAHEICVSGKCVFAAGVKERCTAIPPTVCNCPPDYVLEKDVCTPKCYYSEPKCLMPTIMCSKNN